MMNKSRFVASLDVDKCIECKSCIKRCPLELYSFNKDEKNIEFNNEEEYCW